MVGQTNTFAADTTKQKYRLINDMKDTAGDGFNTYTNQRKQITKVCKWKSR